MYFLRFAAASAAALSVLSCSMCDEPHLPSAENGLHCAGLPQVWDEAVPLGNGMVGALLWEKDGKLRLSLDRSDLWDLRDVPEFDSPDYNYSFVCEQVLDKKDITPVMEMIDARTREDSAPTKIPAGGLEFDISRLGEVSSVDLDIATAVCDVAWKNGAKAEFFIPADACGGYFRFENVGTEIGIELKAPHYSGEEADIDSRDGGRGHGLETLGYERGAIDASVPGRIVYEQKAWGDVAYRIEVQWNELSDGVLEGWYEVTSVGTGYPAASSDFSKPMTRSFENAMKSHRKWWRDYWMQSSVSLPDTLLERQWYLEMYKFGASSRRNAPPISLQAVWTADNGETPPWRGDYHSDLNTQMSYWPGYVSNHLDASASFTDWLWNIKDNSEEFTRKFFQVEGMNVAGVGTLTGKPLGGWEQYSHSPSAAGWHTWHFYQQWRYSMDEDFLANKAYPWVKEVAKFFENISVQDEYGRRSLPLSSSPEINDNRIDAWFSRTTNYDLANIRVTYVVAQRMAEALGLTDEAEHYESQLAQWHDFAVGESGLLVAPGFPMAESHRHLSHLMAIYPFGLIDVNDGEYESEIISRSIENEKALGSDWWTGYSFAWFANMLARSGRGDEAAEYLRIFAEAFCSANSFHLNGDQSGKGYSRLTYRPFTLEGNFAFAAGVLEMLLQSHTGVIRVFPAIPSSWNDVSFRNLRAEGAFLVSAVRKGGETVSLSVTFEKGGLMRLEHPVTGEIIERSLRKGETFSIDSKSNR